MKLVGVLLILFGAVGVGRQNNANIRAHYRQLIHWKECILRLEQGISLKHPLPELLRQMKQEAEPFGSFFAQLVIEMEKYEYESPFDIWTMVTNERVKSFHFTIEEQQLFYNCGRILEMGSRDMAAKEVGLLAGQIDFYIKKEQEELANKLKVNMYLSASAGIFLILLLI